MDRKQHTVQFDARHAAIRLVQLEDLQTNIQKLIDARQASSNEVKSTLIDILSALPVSQSQKAHISDGADFILEAFDRSGRLDAPVNRNGGTKTAMKELEKLADIGNRLRDLLKSMHRDTLIAIGGRDKSSEETATKLRKIAKDIMGHALIGMESMVGSDSKADPPAEKRRARQVTLAAIEVYEGLVLQRATRRTRNAAKKTGDGSQSPYGPAKDYLDKIYGALGIDARADSQMKLVRKNAKRSRGKRRARWRYNFPYEFCISLCILHSPMICDGEQHGAQFH